MQKLNPNATLIQELIQKHFGFYTDAAIAQLLKELPNNLVIADSAATETKMGTVKWYLKWSWDSSFQLVKCLVLYLLLVYFSLLSLAIRTGSCPAGGCSSFGICKWLDAKLDAILLAIN